MSTSALTHYDQLSKHYLDETTVHPPDNIGGGVIWNTRFYLESLLTAYNATGDPKYIQAFLDTGTWVMNLTQVLTYIDQADPSAPGKVVSGPLLSTIGWPTYLSTFGVPVAIPTATGQIALYAQSLYPRYAIGAGQLKVTENSDGSLQLAWWRAGQALQSFIVHSVDDLNNIASQPLIYGQTPGRLSPTGLGLPAPGLFAINTPLLTVWHGEQSGGILLPFVEFLLIVRDHPGLVDAQTASTWQSKILAVSAEYTDQFVPDGKGGLLIRNAQWMPNTEAGLYADADYVFAEATMRLLLYELTHDPKQLAISNGLILHQENFHWQMNPQGWLLLKISPCRRPWSDRSQAPAGSIWDSLAFDPSTPELAQDGGFVADLLHSAKIYGLDSEFGLSNDIYAAHRKTFQEYLRTPLGLPTVVRYRYPRFDSTTSDSIVPSDDAFAGSGFLQPEVRDDSFVAENMGWMSANGQNPNGEPIGYFLRAWARTEAATLQSCQAQTTQSH